MSLPMVILLVLLIVAVLVLVRYAMSARRDNDQEELPANREDNAYHAVSIKITGTACRAARDMAGRRFLSSTAPRLPLPKCDSSNCKCRFVHHDDRRSGRDRRSPFSVSGFGGGSGNFEVDRRNQKDRRRKPDDDETA